MNTQGKPLKKHKPHFRLRLEHTRDGQIWWHAEFVSRFGPLWRTPYSTSTATVIKFLQAGMYHRV